MELRFWTFLQAFSYTFFVLPKDNMPLLEKLLPLSMEWKNVFSTIIFGHIPSPILQILPVEAKEMNIQEFSLQLTPVKDRLRIIKIRQLEKEIQEGFLVNGYLPRYLKFCIKHLNTCQKCQNSLFDYLTALKSILGQ